MKQQNKTRAYVAVVLDISDNSHCEITVLATDGVAAARLALEERKEMAGFDEER